MNKLLIKISGDLIRNKAALQWIRDRQPRDYQTVIIVGGGTQINERLDDLKMKYYFKDGIRVHQTHASKYQAMSVLLDNRIILEKELQYRQHMFIVIPCIVLKDIICHYNADDYLRLLAPSFDDGFCLTVKGRAKKFMENIHVVEFDLKEPEPERVSRVDA